jgi:hypothetical protein
MNYEEKRLYRIARAEELAQKAEKESEQRYKAAKQIGHTDENTNYINFKT